MPESEQPVEATREAAALVEELSELLEPAGPVLMTYAALYRLPPGHGFELVRLLDSRLYQLVSKPLQGGGPATGAPEHRSRLNRALQKIVGRGFSVGVEKGLAAVVDLDLPIWSTVTNGGANFFHVVEPAITVTRAPDRQLRFCVVRREKRGTLPVLDK